MLGSADPYPVSCGSGMKALWKHPSIPSKLVAELDSRGIDDSLSKSLCMQIHILRCLGQGVQVPAIMIHQLLAENDSEN
jgi:hypothetical protein